LTKELKPFSGKKTASSTNDAGSTGGLHVAGKNLDAPQQRNGYRKCVTSQNFNHRNVPLQSQVRLKKKKKGIGTATE
jgi:hypothetical protein